MSIRIYWYLNAESYPGSICGLLTFLNIKSLAVRNRLLHAVPTAIEVTKICKGEKSEYLQFSFLPRKLSLNSRVAVDSVNAVTVSVVFLLPFCLPLLSTLLLLLASQQLLGSPFLLTSHVAEVSSIAGVPTEVVHFVPGVPTVVGGPAVIGCPRSC
jgi:hypothetical protein